MKFKKLFNLKKRNRHTKNSLPETVAKRPQPRASAFVLESMETRVMMSATPMELAQVPVKESHVTAALVSTNYADYAPGETAVITTSNTSGEGLKFSAGELVRFQVTRTDGVVDNPGGLASDAPAGNAPWYVIDGVGGFAAHQQFDANGQAIDRDADGQADWIAPDNDLTINASISTAWFVEEQYRGASLQLTAMGQNSGAVANTAFTDAATNTTTTVSSSSATTTYGTSVTFTATVTAAAGLTRPTGTVQFFDGATLLGTDSIPTNGLSLQSTFSISTSSLNAGSHSIHAVFTGTAGSFNDSSSVNITQTVNQKSLTGSITAANKTYDGNTAATVTTSLSGVVAGDVGNVSLTGGTATFSSTNVGNTKTVTLTGATLTGTAAGNYTLSSVGTDQANITALSITGNFTVANKTYNGTSSATVLTRTLTGVLAGDVANVTWTNGTATFSNANAGIGKTVTMSGASLSGTAAGNYTLSSPVTSTANIDALGITGSFTAANKTYNGTNSATVSTRTLTGVLAGDVGNVSLAGGTATFSSANVGNAKTVTLAGATLSGTAAGNYTLTSVGTTTANITALSITGSFTAADKTYDGNTAATVLTRTLVGVVAGDVGNVSLTGGTATFSSTNVGNTKTVTLTGATLTGTAAGNYTLSSVGTDQANITALALTGNFTVVDKIYNGSTSATVLVRSLVGVVAGDVGNVTWTNGTATFNTASAGIGKTVTITGASLSGSAAGNYTMTSTVTSTGNITALAITGNFTAANKTYDGTAEATLLTSTLTGVLAGDVANVILTGTATFSNANAGIGKTVTLVGATLTGTAAGNYTLTSVGTTSASIAKADASVTVHGFSGVYDAAAHGATGTVIGEGGVDLSANLTLGVTFTNAPGGTANWVFSGGTNYNDQSGSVAIVIAKADAVVTVTGFTGVYDAAAHGATGTATGAGGVDLSADLALGDSFTNVPGGTATWAFSGGLNYNDQSGSVAIVINKATATVNVTGYTGVYDAAAHAATGTVKGVLGESLSGLDLGGIIHTNAGIYSDSWTFTDITGNYKNASGVVDTNIDMADAVITVTGYTGVYDGAAHGATGKAVGVLGETLNGLFLNSTIHTNAGSYTDSWEFAPAPGNYKNATGSVSSSIAKATATISVSGYAGVYDGSAHTATGTALGLTLGNSLSIPIQDYGTVLENSPTGLTNTNSDGLSGVNGFRPVNTLFPADQEVQITMAGAPAVGSGHYIFVFLRVQNPNQPNAQGYYIGYQETGTSGIWTVGRMLNQNDTSGHQASGTLLTSGDQVRASVVGNTVTAYSYHGGVWKTEMSYTMTGADIVSGPGSLGFEISGASPEIRLTNVIGGAYTGGTAMGVLGETLSGLDLSGTSHSNAGSYSDSWTFTDSTGNYVAASGIVNDSLAKADATVTVSGYTSTYDGAVHTATGTAVGVLGESLSGLDLSGTAHTNAGAYTDSWIFTNANYKNVSGTVNNSIAKADATVAVSGFSGVYDAAAHGATGTATGVGGVDLSAGLALGDSFTNAPGGTASWAFTGGGNYNDQSGSVAIVIAKADATVAVSGFSGVYDAAAHGATGTATGVGGVDLSAGLALGDSFTNAPGGTASWAFTGGGNYNDQSGNVAIVIAKADATVAVSGFSGTYDAAAHGATGTATGVGGVDLSAGLALGDSFTNAPGGTASWAFTGGGNYNDQSGSVAIVIAKADATVAVSGFSGTYDAAAHGATGTATGVGGVDLSAGLALGDSFTNAPGGTASWAFTGGGNYNDQSGSVAIVIAKADATVAVSGFSGTYDAAAHGATGTATGVGGVDLSAGLALGDSFTNAPGGTASWAFTGGGNYNDQSGSVAIVIAKADATVAVSGFSGTYDAAAHGATGTATGVGGVDLSAGLALGDSFTNAPGGTASWAFTGGGNYNDQSGSVAIVIAKADATVAVSGFSGTYDAAAHGATGTATGVGGVDLSAGLALGDSFTNAPGGTASWAFTGGGNYNDQSGSVAIVIAKADATVAVSGFSGTYDAAAHGATGTATGVGGVDLSAGLALGDSFTNAPGGTASWAFTGGGNYNDQSGSVAIVIAKADATVAVSGFSGTYDAAAHGATGTATGVGGVDLSAGLALGDSFTNAPGGTASWAFTGGGNYNDQSGSVAIVIAKADATVAVSGFSGTYDAAAHGATGTATGVGGVDLSAGLALGDSFTNAPGGTASWAFTGGGNYNDQSGSVAIVIAKADATVAVSGFSGTYDAAAHGATGTATGVGGVDLSAGLALGDSFTNAPGGTASWAFTGGGNYNDQSGSVAIVIAKADATVAVSGFSGTYDAAAHGATGTATGVLGESLSGLDLSDTVHTNAGTYSDTWTFTDSTGNYKNASGTVNTSIAKALATLIFGGETYLYDEEAVLGYKVTYNGAAHGATGTATGVLGESLSGLDLSGTAHTNAGIYTDSWTFTDATGNYEDTAGSISSSIAKAVATVTVTGYSGTYDAAAHGATGTVVGGLGESLSGLNLSATNHTNAGTYSDTWTFTDSTGNYKNASGKVSSTIEKALATLTFGGATYQYDEEAVLGYKVTYDGVSHTATGTAVGVLGESLSSGLHMTDTAHRNAGVYTDIWTFTDATGNYWNTAGSINSTIFKATVTVKGYNGVYDGAAHGATVKGVLGETLSGLTTATHINAGTYSDTWTYTDTTGNYKNASGSVTNVIAKATATVTVTGYTGTYDGVAHMATGTVKGVGGVVLSGLNLSSTAHTNAGTYTDSWTFTDSTGNYKNASGTVKNTISKATAIVMVTGYTGVYDAVSHKATGTVVGVLGESLIGLNLNDTAHRDAGVYTDTWTFTDATGNYKNASGTVGTSIAKAIATVTMNGYTGAYNGAAHGAAGTATGVGGVNLSAGLNLGATFINIPGGTANWTFSGGTNYTDRSGSVAIVII